MLMSVMRLCAKPVILLDGPVVTCAVVPFVSLPYMVSLWGGAQTTQTTQRVSVYVVVETEGTSLDRGILKKKERGHCAYITPAYRLSTVNCMLV